MGRTGADAGPRPELPLGLTLHSPPPDHDAVVAALRRPRRVAALRASGVLDAPATPALVRLATLAARALATPIGSVSLVDADRQVQAAHYGLPAAIPPGAETPLEMSFCRFTVAVAAAVAIDDTRLDPRTRAMRSVTELGIHAYLGAPLLLYGEPIGALCVMDREPRAWSAGDAEMLVALSAAVTTEIELAIATRERALLHEAERGARAAAAAANRAKFDFLAVMSHELRTPLNAIGGYVDLMEMGLRGPITDAQHRDLARVKSAQQHLLGLINDVLNLSKLEEGRVAYTIGAVPLGTPVASAAAVVAPQLAARGIAFAAAPCPDDAVVRADPEKVRQILLNLLSNALKFTPRGGTIGLRCAAEDGHAAVRVTDTGVGIPRDKLAAVFDPFVQIDRGLNRPGAGIGLGLAISRDLARGMGGDLTAESEPGRGSVFTLTLPRE